MARFVWGPSQEFAEEGLPAVGVAILGIRRGGLVDFSVGEADPATHQPLSGLHVVYLAAQPAATDDPKAVLDATAIKGSADPAALAKGGAITVTVAGVVKGSYWVQSILEFVE